VTTQSVRIDYYTDVLCIWAYIAQIKVDQIRQDFGESVDLHYRYLSLFGNNLARIGEGWKDGGFAGYGAHVCKVAAPCDYVEVNPEVWSRNAPATSLPAHLYLNAVEILAAAGTIAAAPSEAYQGRTEAQELAWRIRQAFFRDLRDVSNLDVLREIAEDLGLPIDAIEREIHSGAAFARLSLDIDDKERLRLEGSPTFILNEGRQKLYGNVGYDVIATNIRALQERASNRPVWR
jgi:predicted DsbA family dithiol-disulfide isomerase